jgi:hypothetical protein
VAFYGITKEVVFVVRISCPTSTVLLQSTIQYKNNTSATVAVFGVRMCVYRYQVGAYSVQLFLSTKNPEQDPTLAHKFRDKIPVL